MCQKNLILSPFGLFMNVHSEAIIKLGMKIRFKRTSSYAEQGLKYFSSNIFKDKYSVKKNMLLFTFGVQTHVV